MNRLTNDQGFARNVEAREEMYDKLFELENIEEELGIDLIFSVNICKKVNNQKYVYVKESYGINKLIISDNLDVELFNHRLYANSRGIETSLDLKDYGKKWGLTKEELEKTTSKKMPKHIGDLICKELKCENCPLYSINCDAGDAYSNLYKNLEFHYEQFKDKEIYDLFKKRLDKEIDE